MMEVTTLIQVYIAFLVVILLHELGHVPESIKLRFHYGIPSAAAMRAKYRLGGLVVNIILFLYVYLKQPEYVLFQYVGLLAWLHFIIYAIIGSIVPEPPPNTVNLDTYVFDDVPNEWAWWFILLAVSVFFMFKGYYLPILEMIFSG